MKIGILAIQGSVIEHRHALVKLGVEVVEVRLPEDLADIQGVILPGGESTTQSKLMQRFGLFNELKKKIENGLPAWGTCAGAILLSKVVEGKNVPPTLQVMDISAKRNAYGSQIHSFDTELVANLDEKKLIQGVFIRAPQLNPLGDQVESLAYQGAHPVMLRQKNMLVTAFHPELTDDLSVHQYFIDHIVGNQ